MKKFVTAIFAVMIVAMSCVTAFAAPSPQANVIPNGSGSNAVADSGPKSPQTGSSDVLPYALMGISALACGTVAVMFVKTGKSR